MKAIIASAFFFLLPCVVVSGPRPSQPNPGAVDVKLIEQACQHAPKKDLCVNTLKTDPNAKGADLTGLTYIAIRLAGAYASDVDEHLRTLLIKNASTLDPAVQQGVADCIEHYSDANELLDNCVAAMSTKSFKDVQTWVNVAISDAEFCDGSLSGQETVVAEKNEAFRQLCKNVLAIVKVLEASRK